MSRNLTRRLTYFQIKINPCFVDANARIIETTANEFFHTCAVQCDTSYSGKSEIIERAWEKVGG